MENSPFGKGGLRGIFKPSEKSPLTPLFQRGGGFVILNILVYMIP
jgi:hypothetical protein